MDAGFPIDEDVFSIQFSSSAASDLRTPVWRAIGLLISNYAKVETALHMYARRLSGLDDAKARVLLSTLRISEVIARVKSLHLLSGTCASDIAEFEVLSKQMQRITEARHLLVHNGVSFIKEDEILTHKKFVSKDATSYPMRDFSLEKLHAMVDDCGCIAFRLLALCEPQDLQRVLGGHADDMKAFARSPWRY